MTIIVEWGRLSAAMPDCLPLATAQIEAASVIHALRLAGMLAHTLTEDRARDAAIIAAITGSIKLKSNSALKANGRAVFWGVHDDWFVSITHTERHAADGGYRHIAENKVKALWTPILSMRRKFPLEQAARNLLTELRQMHAHYLPSCKGGCPAETYIAEAVTSLKLLEAPGS